MPRFTAHKLKIAVLAYIAVMALLIMQGVLWQVHYVLNKNYIAQELCENRNNALLHCEGKCYLHKKLLEAEQKRSQDFSPPAFLFLWIFFESYGIELPTNSSAYYALAFPPYQGLYQQKHLMEFFHPPRI